MKVTNEPRRICFHRNGPNICTRPTGHPGNHEAWNDTEPVTHWANEQENL